jgi:BolA protein
MGQITEAMRDILTARLSPTRLIITDQSALHAGHAGASDAGESHFDVTIESAAFAGLGRLARQRLVHSLLSAQLQGPVHALSLRLFAPGEA